MFFKWYEKKFFDWPHTVHIGQERSDWPSMMSRWCDENGIRFRRRYVPHDMYDYSFKRVEDAIAFKLRWS